jgi:hypothetical protein
VTQPLVEHGTEGAAIRWRLVPMRPAHGSGWPAQPACVSGALLLPNVARIRRPSWYQRYRQTPEPGAVSDRLPTPYVAFVPELILWLRFPREAFQPPHYRDWDTIGTHGNGSEV